MKKIYCLLFAFIGVMANAQTIFSIAGGTGGGYGGDGGPATSAQLGLMQGPITKDAAGNIYIPDMNNQRIRKIDAVTGIITTIAGTGTPGYNGDAIAATSAKLNYPSCVLLDATGNIYIGEYSGYRIRKIDASTGLISTIIGNGSYTYNGNNILATSATTKEIGGLAIDAAGNIYFSDMGNQIIRKIIVSTGMVQTVAGTAGSSSFGGDGGQATSAQLWGPYAISLDASENIFIADELNNRIRKVVASTGIISTIAGRTNSMYDYNGDGIAADTADLYDPWGVAVDASGNVYIADADNNRIRKVNTNG
ncbi:MAG TPA: SMP-30/gluconolactonase/LRE family protein, partial [Bacteroidia bacterium]|nr:SMP-30/gluconolactonase/LRE family protein [Bacteroidia bacterium]